MTPGRAALATVAVLGVCAALPLLSLVGHPHDALADPLSELPVKLWVFETFPRLGFFRIDTDLVGYPDHGALNNADPIGTVLTFGLRPLVGRAWAYDLTVWLQLWADALSVYALARLVTPDRGGAILAGVVVALTPLMLLYCVTGAVTDMLGLWPYVLALRSGLLALSRPGWRDAVAAGLWASLGLVQCAYHAPVFAAAGVPLLFWGWSLHRRGPGALPATADRRQLGRAALGIGVTLGGGVAIVGFALSQITGGATSHLSQEVIAATRHYPPFQALAPIHPDRFTTFLSDFVVVGKDAVLERNAGSRYLRAFSPGFTLVALALVGAVAAPRRGRAIVWLLVAVWCGVVSTGPFLPVTAEKMVGSNPAYLLCYYALGGILLLEPFRYALMVPLGLGIAAAVGVEVLAARFGRWVWGAALGAWLAELVVVSPVPVPLPTTDVRVPATYFDLDARLPEGPIIELPYFDRGTDRFVRAHFLHQLVHLRPIPDAVIGFPPRWLCENQFTAALLAEENRSGRLIVRVQDPSRIDADRAKLVEAGFVGIVVDPERYRDPEAWRWVRQRLEAVGPPERTPDGLYVYRLR